jgi:hypothetical protein
MLYPLSYGALPCNLKRFPDAQPPKHPLPPVGAIRTLLVYPNRRPMASAAELSSAANTWGVHHDRQRAVLATSLNLACKSNI